MAIGSNASQGAGPKLHSSANACRAAVAPTVLFETERLRIRLLSPADADFILELVNEPAWLRFIGDRNVRSRADAEAYIGKCLQMYREHAVGSLGVELKETGGLAGICGLIKREHRRDIDLGFAFLERFRGRGYAFEAAQTVLQHGHATLRLRRIVALTHPENNASMALLGKLGFAFEGLIYRADGSIENRLFAHAAAE